MAGVRRGARATLRYFVALYVVAVVVQIFLAGEGIFGIKKNVSLDDQKTLDAHRGLGFFLADLGAIVFLILALLAWYPNKRIRVVSIALPFMLFIQGILGGGSRWVGAFHPLWGFIILGTLGFLAHRLWRTSEAMEAGPEAAPSVSTG
jgi:hypothetical protein